MPFTTPEKAAEWLRKQITEYLESPENDLRMPGGPEPAYGPPLIGFVTGDDPLWNAYKEHVGSFHWTPLEAFFLAFPGESAAPEELSVVSWVLPQTVATRNDQRRETELPSERWARARVMGEALVNNGLRNHLLARLESEKIQALAPVLLPEWERRDSERFVFASTWSERHAAYAAGHGTFGLCDGLITPAGKAMRVGSLILRQKLPASGRPYTSHREYCLFFNSGICGKCIKRCPAGALSPAGHDKQKCKAYVREVTAPFIKDRFGFEGYGCGFCQVGVPCEAGIPPRPKKRAGKEVSVSN